MTCTTGLPRPPPFELTIVVVVGRGKESDDASATRFSSSLAECLECELANCRNFCKSLLGTLPA